MTMQLILTINDRKYEIIESLPEGGLVITDDTLTVSNNVYEQLHLMLRKICDQCYLEEIVCKI